MSSEHIFIDTNILVYAHDTSTNKKHLTSKRLINDLWISPYPPAISTQVLQELYVNLIRKNISSTVATKLVESYFAWEVITVDPALLSHAFAIQSRYQISFWDSLIVAAAKRAAADCLLSEDLSAGQKYEGIVVRNPFQ